MALALILMIFIDPVKEQQRQFDNVHYQYRDFISIKETLFNEREKQKQNLDQRTTTTRRMVRQMNEYFQRH